MIKIKYQDDTELNIPSLYHVKQYDEIDGENVVCIEVSGDSDITEITSHIENIPFNTIIPKKQKWFGDHAKFIAEHLQSIA